MHTCVALMPAQRGAYGGDVDVGRRDGCSGGDGGLDCTELGTVEVRELAWDRK